MKPKLLLLTNPENSDPQEDVFLAKFLSRYFEVNTAHPFRTEGDEDNADIVLVRNIWPTKDHMPEYQALYEKLERKGVPTYNPHNGSGDMKGKLYLSELYKDGYPVIPTIASLTEIERLPATAEYFVKPIYGGSSEGVRKVGVSEIQTTNLTGYVIQPFVHIKHEVSFYYIDGVLQHALYNPDPNNRWKLAPFTPSAEQRAMAERFVTWNSLSYGIQRIDCCITEEGQFLLIEIEDWCPFLSLLEVPQAISQPFLDNLVASLRNKIK